MLLSVLLPRKGKFRGRYSALFPNAEDRRWVFSPSLSLSSLSRACEKPWAAVGQRGRPVPGAGGGGQLLSLGGAQAPQPPRLLLLTPPKASRLPVHPPSSLRSLPPRCHLRPRAEGQPCPPCPGSRPLSSRLTNPPRLPARGDLRRGGR